MFPKAQTLVHLHSTVNGSKRPARSAHSQLWYENTFPLTYSVHAQCLKISRSVSSWTLRKLERERVREKQIASKGRTSGRESGKWKGSGEISPRTRSIPYNSSVTLFLWVARTFLLRKEITSQFRRQHFNCFVVNRSRLGPAEAGSSGGRSKGKLTSLEKFYSYFE